MDLNVFKDKLFAQAKAAGFEEYELYFQNSASTTVSVFNQEVSEFTNSASAGVSFRGKHGGKMGYASSERIDDQVIDFLVAAARDNAAIIETEEHEELYPGSDAYPAVKTYNPTINDVPSEDKIKLALRVEAAAKQTDARVMAVPNCAVANAESAVFIANSKGLSASKNANAMYSYANCQAGDGNAVKMAMKIFFGSGFDDFDPEKLGQTAANNAVAKLGAASVASGKYNVIIDAEAAGSLLTVNFSGFSAESAQKGFSLLKGKLNEQIANPAVTIVDDPLIDWAYGSQPFDSEGVAAFKKVVVDAGVFKTFLHNTKTARQDGVAPTGNGMKADFKSPVNIGATNFFIQPTDKTPEELMAQLGDGILITDFAGIHAGANPTSGEFSLQAQGFVVEGGKKGRAVEQITVSGNFYQLLKSVTAVANDLNFRSNIASPSILVEGLDVAGAE